MSSEKEFDGDAGAPLPDFTTNIQLQTVAPALGVGGGRGNTPDYLDYDQKGRGVVTTMFANAGAAYMMGIASGGLYGLRIGLQTTPSSRFKVKLNSVLNHCGRHGSRAGNTLGVFAVMYSLYEGLADHVSFKKKIRSGSILICSFFLLFLTASNFVLTFFFSFKHIICQNKTMLLIDSLSSVQKQNINNQINQYLTITNIV